MRRAVLLAGGALVAGVFALARPGDSEPTSAAKAAMPKAMIDGAPLVAKPETPKGPPTVQLEKMELVGDHYEAPLTDGTRVKLTLDPVLQHEAEKLLDRARAPRGAIIAMAPDGRILAIAGRRTAEPKGGKHGDPDFHLATEAWAPSASVFKLVTASALVEAGVDPDGKVCFHGGIRSVNESNLTDSKRDNRCESLLYGVAHSNNAILGKLAYQHLQPSALDALAHDLLGTNAVLTLPHEKNLAFAQSAAGFHDVKLSVMGGALLAATFADGGEQPVPHLIADAAPASHRILPADVAKAVSRMMVGTCEFGSAHKSFGRKHSVAGKTGTLTTDEPFYMENSWFVGYAPVDKPEIIVSVLLGNPVSWHLRGHEAARMLIDRAMQREQDRGAVADDRPRKHRR